MRKHPRAIVLLLLAATLVCGCGKDPNLPDLYATSGTVTLDGQALDDAVVLFRPTGNTRGTESYGRTDAQGRYTLTSRHLGEGTPAGEYRVTIGKLAMPDGSTPPSGEDFDPMTMPTKQLLPAYYSHPASTQLTATVPEGGGEVDFELSLKGKR